MENINHNNKNYKSSTKLKRLTFSKQATVQKKDVKPPVKQKEKKNE